MAPFELFAAAVPARSGGSAASEKLRKRGVLLVAYGAGNPQSAAALRRVQTPVQKRFDLPARWAYTSETLRERIAAARMKSDSVLKALRRMAFERYEEIAVQSLHLIPGMEYDGVLGVWSCAPGVCPVISVWDSRCFFRLKTPGAPPSPCWIISARSDPERTPLSAWDTAAADMALPALYPGPWRSRSGAWTTLCMWPA